MNALARRLWDLGWKYPVAPVTVPTAVLFWLVGKVTHLGGDE